MKKLFHWEWFTEKTPSYQEYWFISAYWQARWELDAYRIRYDGLPLCGASIGPFRINAGKSYDWLDDPS